MYNEIPSPLDAYILPPVIVTLVFSPTTTPSIASNFPSVIFIFVPYVTTAEFERNICWIFPPNISISVPVYDVITAPTVASTETLLLFIVSFPLLFLIVAQVCAVP